MRDKQVIYLDFDNTLVNTTKAFCKVYNSNRMETEREADWTKVRKWDFTDECPSLTSKEVEEYFGKDYFYMNLEVMPDAIRVLKRLVETCEIRICSIGSPDNIKKKVEWIDKMITSVIPEITDGIYLVKKSGMMGKSSVNMSGAIIIDDSAENLLSSNALVKIRFGIEAEWNENWLGIRAENWNELEALILGRR